MLSVSLSGTGIGKDDAVAIGEQLGKFTILELLDLSHNPELSGSGAAAILSSLAGMQPRAHTPGAAMLSVSLSGTGIGKDGASHLCSVLTHLTAVTELHLGGNHLSADDGARICAAAAAAGMTNLKVLNLIENGFTASDVVACGAWRQLNMPQLPDEVVKKCSAGSNVLNLSFIVSYLRGTDKVASYTIRMFVVGESTVRPLHSLF
jgi:hypothetical protein